MAEDTNEIEFPYPLEAKLAKVKDDALIVKATEEELQKINRVIVTANGWYKEFIQED